MFKAYVSHIVDAPEWAQKKAKESVLAWGGDADYPPQHIIDDILPSDGIGDGYLVIEGKMKGWHVNGVPTVQVDSYCDGVLKWRYVATFTRQ